MTAPLNQTVLRLAYATEDELDRKLILTMQRRGYVVTKARPEEIKIAELARRVGRSVASVSRALARPSCPPFERTKGKRRTLWIIPNEKLLAFLLHPSAGGRPMANRTTVEGLAE